jgi:serine/threonine-protein kinase HipA
MSDPRPSPRSVPSAASGSRGTRWKPITRLDVYYQDDGEAEKVGGLALDRSDTVHFQYDAGWLATGRELSPRELPLAMGRTVVPAPDRRKLHGLHGLFADSLPDRWGMRILDLALRRHGIDPQRAGPLDLLACLGSRTMGALTFHPATRWPKEAERAASLDSLAAQAELVYEGAIDADLRTDRTRSGGEVHAGAIDELERAAGTAGGAQPKVIIATGPEGASLVSGRDAPPGYTAYLLKFTPRRDGLGFRTDCGQIEQAYALMARDAGLDFPQSRLFPTTDGRWHFAVERFDRTPAGGRRHVHTLGGLLGREASDDGDYDELFRLARALTGNMRALEEVLRRLCFNLAVLNDDDHLKNVAFLLDPTEGWQLAPAYDLTFAPTRRGERGMSVDGLEAETTWATVEALAARHGVKGVRVHEIRAEIEACVKRWPAHAEQAHVPEAGILELAHAIKARRQALAR